MKKLAIIPGHNASSQGAVRGDTGETEWSWNGRLADMMIALAPSYGFRAVKFLRKPGMEYSAEIDEVYSRTDQWGADATIEAHFNAFGTPLAEGTETLTSTSAGSRALGAAVQAAMAGELGLPDRGCKAISRSARGGRSLYAGRAPAILTEPFFGSSGSDSAAVDEPHEMTGLAHAILGGAAEALGAKAPKKEPPAPEPATPTPGGLAAIIAAIAALFKGRN